MKNDASTHSHENKTHDANESEPDINKAYVSEDRGNTDSNHEANSDEDDAEDTFHDAPDQPQ